MKSLSIERLKEIFTIRNKKNVERLNRILYWENNGIKLRTKEISSAGYSEKEEGKMYRREKYRHKLYSGDRSHN